MRATPGNYPHHPMPEQRAQLPLDRTFDETQYRALREGTIPKSPDDRWFVFEDEDWVALHHSSTGHCIYRLRLENTGHQWQVAEAWVNRDPAQYDSDDTQVDAQMLSSLLDRIIAANGH